MNRFGRQLCLAALLAAGLLVAPAALAGHQGDRDSQTTVACAPNPAQTFQAISCTATVQDMYGVPGQQSPPTGTVSFSVSSGPGSLSPASCTLAPTGLTGQSACSVSYTATAGGTHVIAASYAGAVGPFNGVWRPSSGSGSVTVNNPSPTITSVSPAYAAAGDTLAVTVNGSNFASAGVTVSFGAGIVVNNVTWLNSGQLSVNITVDPSAATGFRDVTVTNPPPAGGSATLPGGFEVRNPVPFINALSPAAAEEGSGAVTVTIQGGNFVAGSIAYFNGSARPTAFVNSGELTMQLGAGDTAAVGDYNVHVNNPAPGGGSSNNVIFSVVVSGGSFDAVEPGQGVNGRLFTRLAGVAFSVDLLATDVGRAGINTSFSGDVVVELLDAGDDTGTLDANGCRDSWSVAQPLGTHTFNAGDNGRITLAINYGGALRIARLRISHPASGTPTHVGCSGDAFSIRPQAFVLSTPLTNNTTGGTPVHPAGVDFQITANAIAGYDGTPEIDAARWSEHANAQARGTLNGVFPAANPVNGQSSGTAFSYDEAGWFSFDSGGVYDDDFTAVDQPNDCIDGFSNTLTGGQYGCLIGNAGGLAVGRFVPDHFDVEVDHGCDVDGFTYSGQPFRVTVTARNAAGGPTRNYHHHLSDPNARFAKDVTLSDAGDGSNFSDNVLFAMLFDNGAASTSGIAYTFAGPETAYTDIVLRATDTDGASSGGHLEESTEIRSGRLAMSNGTAITTHDGFMQVLLQTWQEAAPGVFDWDTHADDDTCTVLGTGSFSFDAGSYTDRLDAGETSIINFNYADGVGLLALSAPGAGNDGSVRIDVNADDWLHFDWNGAGQEAPHGVMRFFEVFETERGFISRDEVINP